MSAVSTASNTRLTSARMPMAAVAPPVPGVPRAVPQDPYAFQDQRVGKDVVLRPGTQIGRYLIQTPLGRGGMGIVYGATDPELNRRVAIKLVRCNDAASNGRFTTRLRREALALARLSHPNIVSLYDIGTAHRGVFMAMEFVRGENLRQWLKSGTRSWQDILAVLLPAGRGLAAAHEAGIVHRDFKPTNVMVGPHGAVKVLDFGLARGTPQRDSWLDSGDSLCRKMTRGDTVVGTTGYMAPEQLLGGEVGPWSDQFSFCVTLFEALYGHRPYPGENPVEAAEAFSANKMREPSRERRRKVPSSIHEILMRGLKLDPADRFADIETMMAALQNLRPAKWKIAAAAAALAGTAMLSAVVTAWVIRDSENTTQAAEVCEAAKPRPSAAAVESDVMGSELVPPSADVP